MAKDPQDTGTIDLFGKLQDNSRRQTVRMNQSQQVGANPKKDLGNFAVTIKKPTLTFNPNRWTR